MTRRIPVFSFLLIFVILPAAAQHAPFVTLLESQFGEIGTVSESAMPDQRESAGIAAVNGVVRVIWIERVANDAGLYTRAFASDGSPLDTPQLLARSIPNGADIAASSSHFAIAWATGDGVFVFRVGIDGSFEGEPTLMDSRGSRPSVASDGLDFLVVWDNVTNHSAVRRIVARAMAHDGRMIADAAEVSIESGPVTRPRITWSGWRYFVVWGYESSLYSASVGRYVSPSGAVLGSQPLTLAKFAKYQPWPVSVASNGAESLVTLSSQIVRTDDEGAVLQRWGPWWDSRGDIQLSWTGQLFAGSFVKREGSAPGLIDIVSLGPRTLGALAIRNAQLVLATARIVERRRLVGRE